MISSSLLLLLSSSPSLSSKSKWSSSLSELESKEIGDCDITRKHWFVYNNGKQYCKEVIANYACDTSYASGILRFGSSRTNEH